jgi:hypothetical protein
MCPISVFSAAGETNSSAYRRPSGPDNLSAKRLNCLDKPTFLRGQRMGSIWVLKAVVQGMSIVLRAKSYCAFGPMAREKPAALAMKAHMYRQGCYVLGITRSIRAPRPEQCWARRWGCRFREQAMRESSFARVIAALSAVGAAASRWSPRTMPRGYTAAAPPRT